MRGKWSVVAFAVLAAALSGCGNDDGTGTNCNLGAPAKVGVAISRSGAAEIYGTSQENGLSLAHFELKSRYPHVGILLEFEDDGSDPATGTAAFSSLIDRDVVALIGPTLSSVALEADPVAQEAGIPVLAVSNTAAGITEIGDFIFRDSLTEAQVIPSTVAAAKEAYGLTKVALLYGEDDAFTRSGAEVFQQALADAGIEIVTTQTYATGDTDFSAQLGAVADAGPDALVVSALGAEAGPILTQARDAGLDVPVIGGNGFNSPAVLEAAGDAAEGLIVGAAWNRAVDNPESEEFVQAYTDEYGAPPDQFAAQAYTGMELMGRAIADACSDDPEEIRDALAALKDVPTPLGSFSFTTGRDADHEPVVQVVEGGELTILRSG